MAAFSIVRLVGLALSVYVAALGSAMTLAAATRWTWADNLTRRCASPGVRRLIIGGGLAAGLSVPNAGSATSATVFELTDLGLPGTEFELTDLGAPGTEFELTDLGAPRTEFEVRDEGSAPSSAPTSASGSRSPGDEDCPRLRLSGRDCDHRTSALVAPPGPPAPIVEQPARAEAVVEETWTVEPGDHLWSIAAETVEDRGGDGSGSSITAYWLRLIERNRDVVGDNPDLIHPGQVIILPD